MGPCQFKGGNGSPCTCTSGECTLSPDDSRSSINCNNCGHLMELHGDYKDQGHTPNDPPSLTIHPFEIRPIVSRRERLVNGIIDRAEMYHVILVRGTPACGKTTMMRLVANELLARYSGDIPLYVLTGWDKKQVTLARGWNHYLSKATGIRGFSWPTSRAYLLLDEAQESYWDTNLWAEFFKDISPFDTGASRVILFASYGSPDRGNAGFNPEEYCKTPMDFASGALISMRAEESLDDETIDYDNQNDLGLLLNDEEATDVMNRYITAVGPLPLSKDLMDELFLISSGHVGCLVALMGVLGRASELDHHRRHGTQFELNTVREKLFNHSGKLFYYLKGTPFTRGLPHAKILQRQEVASIFKRAVACDGVSADDLKNPTEVQTLEMIRRNGWLHAIKAKYRFCYIFPSSIHRWFCSYLLYKVSPVDLIHYTTALELAINAVQGFIPRYLSDPPRSSAGETLPLEDQYQKEFYRSFYTLLDGQVLVSPEYIAKKGKGGGTIDFLVSTKKWGFELLRNRNKLVEHMERFESSGAYYDMIKSNIMEHYIMLDISTSKPTKLHPEYRGHLYHVVFSNNYRDVSIVDASDLRIITSFTLSENSNPLA